MRSSECGIESNAEQIPHSEFRIPHFRWHTSCTKTYERTSETLFCSPKSLVFTPGKKGRGPTNRGLAFPIVKEERAMNWTTMKGQWKEFKGKVKERWGKLTDDELDQIAGEKDQLVGKLQQRYGYAKERAQKEVDEFCERC
jgi:uncharacterized protein YjbJ (UPF0337 family)